MYREDVHPRTAVGDKSRGINGGIAIDTIPVDINRQMNDN